jgi:release factor glutamine methyltransferase
MTLMTEPSSQDEQWGPPWTILKLLQWTTQFLESRSETPRLDAEILLAHSLGLKRMQLYTSYDRPLVGPELDAYRALVKRRSRGEPVAYIIGQRGFWTLDLKTDARALIPRPDTEVLVEEALARLDQETTGVVIDVGTGTGAIILAIASERPQARLAATDLSPEALALARENAEALGLSQRIAFFEGDLLLAVDESLRPAQMILSNPPYISSDEYVGLMPDVRLFEPRQALEAGEHGLDVYSRLLPMAYEALADEGFLLVEIGSTQAEAVVALFEQAGFCDVAVRRDYGDRARVVSGRRPS